jgi:hypothetical protein
MSRRGLDPKIGADRPNLQEEENASARVANPEGVTRPGNATTEPLERSKAGNIDERDRRGVEDHGVGTGPCAGRDEVEKRRGDQVQVTADVHH